MPTLRLLAVVSLMPAAAQAQLTIRPGQYEVTIQIAAPGEMQKGADAVLGAAGLEKRTRLECLTANDLKDGLAQAFSREMTEQGCKLSDLRSSGNTMTFTTTCQEDDVRVVSHSELPVMGRDGITLITKSTDDQGVVTTMKVTARRVRDCPTPPPERWSLC